MLNVKPVQPSVSRSVESPVVGSVSPAILRVRKGHGCMQTPSPGACGSESVLVIELFRSELHPHYS